MTDEVVAIDEADANLVDLVDAVMDFQEDNRRNEEKIVGSNRL